MTLFFIPLTYFFISSRLNDFDYNGLFNEIDYFDDLLILLLISFLSTLGHELSHTFSALYYGCRIVECGITLKGIFICFYVKIIGMGTCTKPQKIHILLSGIIFNLLASLISLSLASIAQDNHFIFLILFVFGLSNIVEVIQNSLFIFNLDGNLALKEILGTLNPQLLYKGLNSNTKQAIIISIIFQSMVLFLGLFFNIFYLPMITNFLIMLFIIFKLPVSARSRGYYLYMIGYIFLGGFIYFSYSMFQFDLWRALMTLVIFLMMNSLTIVWIETLIFFLGLSLLKKGRI